MHISKDQRLDAISGRDQMAEKPPSEEASRRFRTPACYSILVSGKAEGEKERY